MTMPSSCLPYPVTAPSASILMHLPPVKLYLFSHESCPAAHCLMDSVSKTGGICKAKRKSMRILFCSLTGARQAISPGTNALRDRAVFFCTSHFYLVRSENRPQETSHSPWKPVGAWVIASAGHANRFHSATRLPHVTEMSVCVCVRVCVCAYVRVSFCVCMCETMHVSVCHTELG